MFDVSKFGDDSFEQISNMKFTDAEKKVLDYVFTADDDFTYDEYLKMAFLFANNNGLNN